MHDFKQRRPESGAIDRAQSGQIKRMLRHAFEESWYLLAIFFIVIPGSLLLYWLVLRML